MHKQRPRRYLFDNLCLALSIFTLCCQTPTALAQLSPPAGCGRFDQGFEQRSRGAAIVIDSAQKLAGQRDFQGARTLYERGTQLDPNSQSAMLHNNLAVCLESLGDYDQAEVEYQKALSFDPNLQLAQKNLHDNQVRRLINQAESLIAQLKYDEALDVYQHALKLDPNRPMLHNNLGNVYKKKGDLEAAIDQYQQALAIDSHMDMAEINSGRAFYDEGKFAQAKHFLVKYLQDHPQGSDAQDAKTLLAQIQKNGTRVSSDLATEDYFRSATERDLFRWPPGRPITVRIESGQGVDGYQPGFREAMIDAFNQWCQAANYRIAWVEAAPGTYPNIICRWTNSNANFTLHNSTLNEQGEVSRYDTINYGEQTYITHTNIMIATTNAATGKLITLPEAQDVCLHEVGHALGLVGHSPDFHDIMFFETNPGGGAVERHLTTRDVATINKLYAGYPPAIK